MLAPCSNSDHPLAAVASPPDVYVLRGEARVSAVWAVLPVRSFSKAKRRLSNCMSSDQRRILMGNLFHTAIRALTETLPVDAIVVVSPDAEVLRDANRLGVHSLLQQHFGLNEAVRQGEAYALQHGAEAVFVLLADLPLATGSEIARVLAHSQGGREAVIVPGQRGGTHALLIRPPGWLSFAFGPGSFERHVIEIVRMGASLTICTSQALAFDIDTEGDLERYPEKSCLLKERDS